MEKIYEKTLLYDFYGELLTDHQKEVYEAVVFNDMSLSEASESFGVSRQGVHDLIRRCEKAMSEYEEKLHLIMQFSEIREKLRILAEGITDGEEKKKLLRKVREISEILDNGI